MQQKIFSATGPPIRVSRVLNANCYNLHAFAGNREIVGFGSNGNSIYWDHPGYPCPAIRFKEPTAEVEKLQEKEKGDWKSLSLAEKKTCMYILLFRLQLFGSYGSWVISIIKTPSHIYGSNY